MSESESGYVAESKVSGNQANIPASIRRKLDIDDGDHLRWRYTEGGELTVEVVHREEGTLAGFDGYDGGPGGDVVRDHDGFGLDRTRGDATDGTRCP